MASGKRKKGIIKKAVISATILLGLIGITYTAVPKVKEFVDDTLDKVVDGFKQITENGDFKSEKLEKVTNIKYSEKERLLTFDENLKARSYNVRVKHDGGSFMLHVDAGVVDVPEIKGLTDGSILTFEVYAVGDGTKTRISDAAVYEHTMEYVSEETYETSKYFLERFLNSARRDVEQIRIGSIEPVAFNIDGNFFIIEGVGKSAAGRDTIVTLKYDFSGYNESTDFSKVTNYKDFILYIARSVSSKYITASAEYSEEFVDLTNLLVSSDAFKEYTDQGYTIEVLKHSNSRVMMENNTSYINYSGIYRAVHKSKPSITFKQENKITIESEKEYLNFSEFLSDAQEKGVVTQQGREIFDQILNDHLVNTLNADSSKYNSNNQEESREQ